MIWCDTGTHVHKVKVFKFYSGWRLVLFANLPHSRTLKEVKAKNTFNEAKFVFFYWFNNLLVIKMSEIVKNAHLPKPEPRASSSKSSSIKLLYLKSVK